MCRYKHRTRWDLLIEEEIGPLAEGYFSVVGKIFYIIAIKENLCKFTNFVVFDSTLRMKGFSCILL